MQVGADLLAVCPQGIVVAAIIDPRGIDKAVVRSSLDPLESWLVAAPDGGVHPLPNPVPRILQSIRGVRVKLAPYLEDKADAPKLRVKGVVVFPDDYDVSSVKKQINYDTATTTMRIVNASELPEEILKPVQNRRMNAERCKKWLDAAILEAGQNGSTAGTWLVPDGAESSKQARAAAGQPAVEAGMVQKLSAGGASLPSRSRTGRIVARIAGLSLALVLPLLVVLWQPDRLRLPIPFAQSPVREDPSNRSVPLEEPQPREAKPFEDSNGSRRPAPAGDSYSRAGVETDADQSHGTGFTDAAGNGEDQAQLSTEAWRKAVEYRIDTAIRNRAVGGVTVSFVDETAYLGGEVISHNQKAAAERAARAVPEVKRVRSSISVMWNKG
jgi:hypothetical protein